MERNQLYFITKKFTYLFFIVLCQYCSGQSDETKVDNKTVSDISESNRAVPKLGELLLHGAPIIDLKASNVSYDLKLPTVSNSLEDAKFVQRRNDGFRNLMSDNLQEVSNDATFVTKSLNEFKTPITSK